MNARMVTSIVLCALAGTATTATAASAAAAKPPWITPPRSLGVEATGPRGAVVRFERAKAPGAAVSYSKASGTMFPLGTAVERELSPRGVSAASRSGLFATPFLFAVATASAAPAPGWQQALLAHLCPSSTTTVLVYSLPGLTGDSLEGEGVRARLRCDRLRIIGAAASENRAGRRPWLFVRDRQQPSVSGWVRWRKTAERPLIRWASVPVAPPATLPDTGGVPDLALDIEFIDLSGKPCFFSQPYGYRVIVHNYGPGAGPATIVASLGGTRVRMLLTRPLPAGVSITLDQSVAGEVVVTIDPDNLVSEVSELNNEATSGRTGTWLCI
jgi:hypothetical protein